jgi:hypothetical protein
MHVAQGIDLLHFTLREAHDVQLLGGRWVSRRLGVSGGAIGAPWLAMALRYSVLKRTACTGR